nr:hypothetical protein [Tanacetum cinerariifolium]
EASEEVDGVLDKLSLKSSISNRWIWHIEGLEWIRHIHYHGYGVSMSAVSEDRYEAIRQAYLVGMDIESEPFEGEAKTPKSPHTIAPPTCRVEESEEFHKRFKSSYDSSPSSTFLVRKRLKGTFEIILDTDSEGDELGEEEDEEDEDPITEDEGHTTRDKGSSMEVKIPGLGGDEAVPGSVVGIPNYRDSYECAFRTWTPPSPKWSSASLHVSSAPSIVPLPILSPMISLFVPSPVATP